MSKYSEGLPMIGHHRTIADVEAEMNRMGYIPDSPISASDIQEAKQNISDDTVSHAVVSARRFGFESSDAYIDAALSHFDASCEQAIA